MDISQIAKASLPVNTGGGAQVPAQAAQTSQPSRAAAVVSAALSAPAQEPPASASRPDPQAVQEAVEKINRVVESIPSNLQFSTDEDTNMNVVKVVDKESGEIIRQFPSEEALAIAKALDSLQGLMVSERA